MRAVIYNNYFETGGGGERSALDLAKALESLGVTVTLALAQPKRFCIRTLMDSFGIERFEPWEVLELQDESTLAEYLRNEDIEMFVNHTFGSFMENPSPLGIYMLMFPQTVIDQPVDNLKSYQYISCNSRFTETYVKTRWSESLPTTVLYPPISGLCEEPSASLQDKEKLILNIGRFNVDGHNKCQFEAINAFRALADQGILNEEWQLVVAGRVNESPENLEYLKLCQSQAEAYNIKVLTNIDGHQLQELYRKASSLWIFTGFGLPFGKSPEKVEHLGLVAVDCFPQGVIPVVYHRGGMNSVIEYGRNGFSFASLEELSDVMKLLDQNFGERYHQRLFDNGLSSLTEFSNEYFVHKLSSLLTHFEEGIHAGQ